MYVAYELRLVLAYPPAPTCVFTPSLARLRASGAGRKRVGTRLAGWHLSPGEQGKEGRQRETSACSIRKSPGGDSTHRFQLAKEQLTAGSCRQTTWLPGICTDWQKMHHTGSVHASKRIIAQSPQTNAGSKVRLHARTVIRGVVGG